MEADKRAGIADPAGFVAGKMSTAINNEGPLRLCNGRRCFSSPILGVQLEDTAMYWDASPQNAGAVFWTQPLGKNGAPVMSYFSGDEFGP